MGLLDGTDRMPSKTLEVEDSEQKKSIVENPAYLVWMSRDQQVLRFLLNSLSPDILSHVLGMDSTAEAWAAITGMFSTASRTKVQHLCSALNDTKKDTMTAHQYFTKMKGFASELAAAGKPLEDDELIGYLLHGLDASYNALVTAVDSNPATTLDDLFGLLSSYDMRNDNTDEPPVPFVSSANAAGRGRDDRSRSRGGDSRDGRDRRDDGRDRRDDGRDWRDRRDDGRRDNRDGGRRDNGRRDGRRDGGDRGDRRTRHDDGGQGRNRQHYGCAPTPYVDVTC